MPSTQMVQLAKYTEEGLTPNEASKSRSRSQ